MPRPDLPLFCSALQIYKSTTCNDMQQSGSCPRGPFCAFAHVERTLFSLPWGRAHSLALLPFPEAHSVSQQWALPTLGVPFPRRPTPPLWSWLETQSFQGGETAGTVPLVARSESQAEPRPLCLSRWQTPLMEHGAPPC